MRHSTAPSFRKHAVRALVTLSVAALALTGWLYTTDRFWGDVTVERMHEALAWSLLGLVAIHVAGVLVASRRHRENLVRSMIDGRKRAPGEDDIA